jgi:8-oxo-dGTP pyrophosphatase MutT (NUDIX family)
VIKASILAAIAARLSRALTLPAVRYRPLLVGGERVGLLDDERAARLARFDCFRVGAYAFALDAALPSCEARSAALARVALALRAEGALPAWRDELFAIAPRFGDTPLFVIERGAARYFGLSTFAAHVNGVVHDGHGGTAMWLARRSPQKAVDPGLLDNLVGGGIAAGLRVDRTVEKEAWEEAGIPELLARTARPAGVVHSRKAMFDGLQRETLFVHDLVLPGDFTPCNQDGEAVEHRLVDLDQAAAAVAYGTHDDEVTLDASLVVVDYLLRWGRLRPDDAGYCSLAALLRLPL